VTSASLLLSIRDGAPSGAPYLVLHGRNGSLEDAQAMGARLGEDALRIAVRGPRQQTMGGTGQVRGYYWFIGPGDRPELSTLGDALYQLELLLLENSERLGQRRIGLYGENQGGVVALVTALIWPDRVDRLIVSDAVLPLNLSDMPLDLPPLDGLPVLLIGDAEGLAETADYLKAHGANPTIAASTDAIPDFIATPR